MKRVPLHRKKPLKAKAPLKRTEWKRTRKTKDRKLDRIRKNWREKFKRCFICNRRPPAEVHEILGGSQFRHLTALEPAFWVAVCNGLFGCHRRIQNDTDWPAARVLAHKLVHDPQGFDLLRFNEIVGGRYRVEMSEVDAWMEKLK